MWAGWVFGDSSLWGGIFRVFHLPAGNHPDSIIFQPFIIFWRLFFSIPQWGVNFSSTSFLSLGAFLCISLAH